MLNDSFMQWFFNVIATFLVVNCLHTANLIRVLGFIIFFPFVYCKHSSQFVYIRLTCHFVVACWQPLLYVNPLAFCIIIGFKMYQLYNSPSSYSFCWDRLAVLLHNQLLLRWTDGICSVYVVRLASVTPGQEDFVP